MAAKGLWTMLNVDDVARSVAWYKGLGFPARSDPMEIPGLPPAQMGVVDLGESGLLFWNKNIVPEGQAPDTKAWVSGELGKGVLLGLGVPNAAKYWANAQKMGAQIDQPLEAQPFGGQQFTIVDLDGYVVNISDKFPGTSPPKKAKKAAKKVATKVKRTARKVAGKGKRK